MAHPQTVFRDSSFTNATLLSVRRLTVAKSTIHAQLDQLRSTGRYDCFKLKWHPVYGDKSNWPVPPHLFWDSDIAKWIEGACYFLHEEHDAVVDNAIQELVGMIREAQGQDGYLNLHYTVVEPDKRWSNLRDMHELYNAGHLIEAALAHRNYYQNNLLLEPIEKYVKLIRETFGPGPNQRHGYPGHPEIELALLRLYAATENQDAYDLARYFLEERGNANGQDEMHYYDWEAAQRGDSPWKRPDSYPTHRSYWYHQAQCPILDQHSIEGHSVRAMYLLTAVADMICLDCNGVQKLARCDDWIAAAGRLWDNMVDKKMYVTGGIGAIKEWEGFGIDYFLPQGTDEGGCYAETCASIAVMMFAERLLQFDLQSRYADVMELCLYNNVMTAMSLDGKAFTYVNQLASSASDKSKRHTWFEVSCCPPNVTRLLGSLGGYLWDYGEAEGDDEVYVNVHLYTSAKLTFSVQDKRVVLEQKSDWPWGSHVTFQTSGAEAVKTTIRLRIPGWSRGEYVLKPAPAAGQSSTRNGYLVLSPSYCASNPTFVLKIENAVPRYINPHPYTNQRTLTLARGAIIYCVEDVENDWESNHFKDVVLHQGEEVTEEQRVFRDTGEKYIALKTKCWRRSFGDPEAKQAGSQPGLPACGENVVEEPRELVFVPYYFRANRGGSGQMRVGLLRG